MPYLDAKITGWNKRDKKISSLPMTYIRSRDFAFEGSKQANFVPIYQQSSYKYLIYAEGHCAACRYGFMMQLGSVILKVESQCVADQMWYFPLLRYSYCAAFYMIDLLVNLCLYALIHHYWCYVSNHTSHRFSYAKTYV